MRTLRSLILLTLVAIIIFYWFDQMESKSEIVADHATVDKSVALQHKIIPEIAEDTLQLEENLSNWIGRTDKDLLHVMGEPKRKDLSAYQYVWWVYTDEQEYYIQFGMEDGLVRTVYATGNDFSIKPIQIGQSYESIYQEYPFAGEAVYTDGVSTYTFRLTPDDIIRRPLVKISDDVFIQFYFDTFTNKLSSIRIMDAEVLLRHQPYEVVYRGTLPGRPHLSEAEWSQVEKGMEQQIFDISNVIRHRFNKRPLEWEEEVSEVAFLHSKDMHDQNYFSHYSLNGDGLKERLDVTGLFYISAGENIAAQYPDAASAVEGWLNSESHREALLTDEYTHLGVGVYRFYYTQNFLAKPI